MCVNDCLGLVELLVICLGCSLFLFFFFPSVFYGPLFRDSFLQRLHMLQKGRGRAGSVVITTGHIEGNRPGTLFPMRQIGICAIQIKFDRLIH